MQPGRFALLIGENLVLLMRLLILWAINELTDCPGTQVLDHEKRIILII